MLKTHFNIIFVYGSFFVSRPPGTGKTFIGVKLVQLLMHNRQTWWKRAGETTHRPILMICYTNHALDQFLESCVNTCKLDSGVVRVGSRSKNEKLDEFLLKNIKRSSRQRDGYLRSIMRDEADNLKNMQSQMNHVNKLLRILFDGCGVLNFKTISKYMTKRQIEHFKANLPYLAETFKIKETDAGLNMSLLDWLGLISLDAANTDLLDENLADYLNEMRLSEEDVSATKPANEAEDDDDGDSLCDERMLDEDRADLGQLREENKITFSEFQGVCIDFEKIDDLRAQLSGDELWTIKAPKAKQAQSETRRYLSKLCFFFNIFLYSLYRGTEKHNNFELRMNLDHFVKFLAHFYAIF
jgi:hypothetical protein